jgi:hypothetical protein
MRATMAAFAAFRRHRPKYRPPPAGNSSHSLLTEKDFAVWTTPPKTANPLALVLHRTTSG